MVYLRLVVLVLLMRGGLSMGCCMPKVGSDGSVEVGPLACPQRGRRSREGELGEDLQVPSDLSQRLDAELLRARMLGLSQQGEAAFVERHGLSNQLAVLNGLDSVHDSRQQLREVTLSYVALDS